MTEKIESIIDEFFALTHLIECQSPLQGTRLFGVPREVMYLVETHAYEGEFRILQEMPIHCAYTGVELAPGKVYGTRQA